MDKNYGYKHTKGFIIFFLVFVIGIISVAYGQVVSGSVNTPSGYSIDATTGNMISNPSMSTSSNWTTGGTVGSFTPDGYTFSFATGTIEQTVNLAGFSHGYQNTGAIFVTGFSYGFKYRFQCANSIGGSCDNPNGLQDNLAATATYYKPDGAVDWTQLHQLGLKNINDGNSAYNPTWQQLSNTYTFSGAKPLAQVGTFNLKITGSDAGYWACLDTTTCYGPQVKDSFVNVNYSVDPCVLNPAFNPSCAGFQNIVQGAKSPTFYYSYNIAQSLPHIGGGVILHGYDYGFSWYNYGACYNSFLFWCTDWRTDGGGNINFRISDKNNTTMLQQQWYVGGNNTGGAYSNRHLFTESRNSLDMGSVQWWTSNVWNHFGWVGWTRPIWTPDPCYTQPLYSPNCSNFDAEIKRIASEVKATQDAKLAETVASISTTPTGSITTTINNATTTSPSVTVTTVENTDESKSSTNGTSFALNLVNKNQQRETTIATQASKNAIESANAVGMASAKQAENIAQNSSNKSKLTSDTVDTSTQKVEIGSSTKQNDTLSFGNEPTNTSVVTAAIQMRNVTSTNQVEQQFNTSTSTSAIVQFNAMQTDNTQATQTFSALLPPTLQNQVSSSTVTVYQPPVQNASLDIKQNTVQPQERSTLGNENILQPNNSSILEQPFRNIGLSISLPVTQSDSTITSSNFLTDRSNPINQIIEQKPTMVEMNVQNNNTQTVKTNVQDNDAAGGVSINSIAVTPVGFNAYTVALKDVAFYAPKEIYRGQKNVDNVRVLRQLASDRLHQEMVEQQYRK